ncbi:hypothetical protein ACFQX6_06100 [Streptosporangium lutulentum]
MTADTVRVGIIGANPDRGWAARAHIPALRALPDFEITAVGTSREASAREAARRFESCMPSPTRGGSPRTRRWTWSSSRSRCRFISS